MWKSPSQLPAGRNSQWQLSPSFLAGNTLQNHLIKQILEREPAEPLLQRPRQGELALPHIHSIPYTATCPAKGFYLSPAQDVSHLDPLQGPTTSHEKPQYSAKSKQPSPLFNCTASFLLLPENLTALVYEIAEKLCSLEEHFPQLAISPARNTTPKAKLSLAMQTVTYSNVTILSST